MNSHNTNSQSEMLPDFSDACEDSCPPQPICHVIRDMCFCALLCLFVANPPCSVLSAFSVLKPVCH